MPGIQLATIQKPFPARRQHFHSLSGTRNVSVAGDDDDGGGVANVVNISSLAFFSVYFRLMLMRMKMMRRLADDSSSFSLEQIITHVMS